MRTELDTQVIKASGGKLTPGELRLVARLWRQGGLVAFPTETVYGLGAHAMDATAVSRIFQVKGRPADNPLIVHVGDAADAFQLAAEVPPLARRLAEAFWPGPLTLVLPAREDIPQVTTGGLATVGIRVPSHPVALQLLRECRLPVAAPSANISGRPSPVTAADVLEDLQGRIHCVVDAGPTGIGVESTVVSLERDTIRVLRPGGVTVEQLQQLGKVEVDSAVLAKRPPVGPVMSPGMKYRHYAPQAPAVVVEGVDPRRVADRVVELGVEAAAASRCVGLLVSAETAQLLKQRVPEHLMARFRVQVAGRRGAPETVAPNIYRCLRTFDRLGVERIVIEGVAPEGMGLAVANRLRKAAGYRVVLVE